MAIMTQITIDPEKFKEILVYSWHLLPDEKRAELAQAGIYPNSSVTANLTRKPPQSASPFIVTGQIGVIIDSDPAVLYPSIYLYTLS